VIVRLNVVNEADLTVSVFDAVSIAISAKDTDIVGYNLRFQLMRTIAHRGSCEPVGRSYRMHPGDRTVANPKTTMVAFSTVDGFTICFSMQNELGETLVNARVAKITLLVNSASPC
jgi:hypothetical protein